jgi:Glycosyltransferase
MTTFIDFRYSRALAAALFAGQEKEEAEIVLSPSEENYFTLEIPFTVSAASLARVVGPDGIAAATLDISADGVLSVTDKQGRCVVAAPARGDTLLPNRLVGIRLGPDVTGLGIRESLSEVPRGVLAERDSDSLADIGYSLECAGGVRVMGRGTGRVRRWGELFYHRGNPSGLCVELTMDWHHLRAGIPLFGTMTAEHLIEQGKFRLRFRSYAYEADDAEATDFVRMFGCDDPADIAVHLTPALYDARARGIPNLAFGVVESENVQPHVVERYNRMDGICVPTRFARDAFQRSGVTRPINVVSHGVDTEFFRPASTPASLPGGRKFNFLAVGTHVERKNFMHLVRAFLEEFREREEVALFLLLRPEYHATQNNVALEFTDWEKRWAHGSAPIHLWTGYLTRKHLRDFYSHANAYVMPSNEGFGLTLLEAMSCGTPVIGLNHGGVLDFLNESNGYLVERGRSYVARDIDTLPYVGDRFYAPDAAHLRAVMREVVENEAEARLRASRARHACGTDLTWDRVTRQFSETIEQTYAAFHAAKQVDASSNGQSHNSAQDAEPVSHPFAWVLCIEDDMPAARSLNYLRRKRSAANHVLCLFTRYARLSDVKRARLYGFVYYRWDGTAENIRVIARGILGRSWIGVLNPGETIDGNEAQLLHFLGSLPSAVGEVEVSSDDGRREVRFIHLRPTGEPCERAVYDGVRIRAERPE